MENKAGDKFYSKFYQISVKCKMRCCKKISFLGFIAEVIYQSFVFSCRFYFIFRNGIAKTITNSILRCKGERGAQSNIPVCFCIALSAISLFLILEFRKKEEVSLLFFFYFLSFSVEPFSFCFSSASFRSAWTRRQKEKNSPQPPSKQTWSWPDGENKQKRWKEKNS